MIELAIKYKDELERLWMDRALDDDAKWEFLGPEMGPPSFDEDDVIGKSNSFVSVDPKTGKVLGEIGYTVNRITAQAHNFYCLRFYSEGGNGFIFMKDMAQVVEDIFYKYNLNKLQFTVAVGNPAEKQWDTFVEKANGKIVGVFKEELCLADGRIYDEKIYEVLKRDYHNSKAHTQIRKRKD